MGFVRISLIALLCLGISGAEARENLDDKIDRFQKSFLKYSLNGYLPEKWKGASWDKLKSLAVRVSNPTELQNSWKSDEDFARFLKSYVLVGSSLSAVKTAATSEFPRKIFFEDRMVVAFTGHSHPKYAKQNNIVEVIYQNCNARPCRFVFKEIDYNVVPVKISEAPTHCAGCHAGRPIWGSYGTWPGVYEDNERFVKAFPASAATEAYRDLVPSLSYLHRRFLENGVDFKEATTSFHFGSYLMALNGRRMADELAQADGFAARKLQALAAAAECPKNYPEEMKALMAGVKQKIHERNIAKLRRFYASDKVLGGNDFFTSKQGILKWKTKELYGDPVGISALKFLFEPLGVDVNRFSMDFAPGSENHGFTFLSGGYLGIDVLVFYLLPQIVREDPSLAHLLDDWVEGREKFCRSL